MCQTTFFVLLLLSCAISTFSQAAVAEPFGWDLTYKTVFERNKLASDARIRGVMRRSNSVAISEILEGLKDETVMSAVLIERPSLDSVGITSLLFLRTKKAAYFWEMNREKTRVYTKTPFRPKLFDKMFKELNRFEQGTPVSGKENGSNWEGYWATLNTYTKGSLRQTLLTVEDLYEYENDRPKPGRVAATVDAAITGTPALTALIYPSCSIRPTRRRIVEAFGQSVPCGPGFGAEMSGASVCFTAHVARIRAGFDDNDRVTSIYLSQPYGNFILARVIPPGSWLGFKGYSWRKKPLTYRQPIDNNFSEYVFRDECITIRNVVSNAATNSIHGYTLVNWN